MGDRAGYAAVRAGSRHWYGRLWIYVAGLLIVGLVCGILAMAAVAALYKNSLQARVQTAAQALSSDHVTRLKEGSLPEAGGGAQPGAAGQSDYVFIENKLARIKEVNTEAHFVYLMARDGTDAGSEVYFLADSEAEYSSGNSPLGEAYPEATPALKEMFASGEPVVEGPVRDSYGTWLSALAPVIDDETYKVVAVIGMDVPAGRYVFLLGLAGGIPLVLAVLAVGMVVIRYQTWHRRREGLRFRAEMLSIASHELRTPLTGLRWSQETLLRQKNADPKQRRMLEIMYDSTRRLQESIEDILQLASLEAGKVQRLYMKELDIRPMLEDITAVQQLAVERRDIAISFSASWPQQVMVNADAQRLKRVFHNLVSNAVKYSNNGSGITIGYEHDKDRHVVFVQDHGIGIPADEQDRIWEGFYRATNTDGHDISGNGMGLYLARGIVEQHGGKIWLESREGEGTTVYVSLPELVPEVAAAPTKGQSAGVPSAGVSEV